jgi:hypothetical protein
MEAGLYPASPPARCPWLDGAVELPDQAARALEVIRRDGVGVRFELTKVCGESRFRLSVRYRQGNGDDVRVGLLYSEDRAGLEELLSRLEATPGGPSQKA